MIDEIVVFHSLTRDQMAAILDIQLRRLRERLADHRIALELDDAARAFLVERGYDPAYGARPLKRAITRYLETPLAREIIAGQVPEGSTVDVAVDGDHLTFTPAIEGEVVEAG